MEDFTPVIKRDAAKQPRQSAGQTTPEICNPFQALDIVANEALETRGGGVLSYG